MLEFADAYNLNNKEESSYDSAAEIPYKVKEGHIIDRDALIEAMTIDLYLREKLKKAPVWAVDLSDKYVFFYEQRDPLTGNAAMIERD